MFYIKTTHEVWSFCLDYGISQKHEHTGLFIFKENILMSKNIEKGRPQELIYASVYAQLPFTTGIFQL